VTPRYETASKPSRFAMVLRDVERNLAEADLPRQLK
jgi:hypothetical protein